MCSIRRQWLLNRDTPSQHSRHTVNISVRGLANARSLMQGASRIMISLPGGTFGAPQSPRRVTVYSATTISNSAGSKQLLTRPGNAAIKRVRMSVHRASTRRTHAIAITCNRLQSTSIVRASDNWHRARPSSPVISS